MYSFHRDILRILIYLCDSFLCMYVVLSGKDIIYSVYVYSVCKIIWNVFILRLASASEQLTTTTIKTVGININILICMM
jgi:hypothetical protein